MVKVRFMGTPEDIKFMMKLLAKNEALEIESMSDIYVRKVGYVKRLDEYEKTVIFTDGIKVDINDIGDIDIKC